MWQDERLGVVGAGKKMRLIFFKTLFLIALPSIFLIFGCSRSFDAIKLTDVRVGQLVIKDNKVFTELEIDIDNQSKFDFQARVLTARVTLRDNPIELELADEWQQIRKGDSTITVPFHVPMTAMYGSFFSFFTNPNPKLDLRIETKIEVKNNIFSKKIDFEKTLQVDLTDLQKTF